MAETDKLYITISYGDGTNGASGGTGEKQEKKSEKETLNLYAQHQMLHLVQQTAMQSLNASIGLIGNLEGEYFKQMKIQEGMQKLGFLYSVGMGALAGAKFGVTGAVIGAGVVLVGETVSWGFNRINYTTGMQKQNRDVELLRMRSGLNSLYDGSRGTEL